MENVRTSTLVLFVFACIFLSPVGACAQPSPMQPAIAFPFSGDSLTLQGNASYAFEARQNALSTVYPDPSKPAPPLEHPELTPFKRLDSGLLRIFPLSDSIISIWIHFSIRNTGTAPASLSLYCPGVAPLIYLFTQGDRKWLEVGKTGIAMPYSWQSIRGDGNRIPLLIPAMASQEFYLRFVRYHDDLGFSIPLLQKKEFALSEYREEENKSQPGKTIQFFLAGFFLAISVYSLLKFFSLSRDKVYLIYALVNAFCCLSITAYFNIPVLENSLVPWIKSKKEICAILSDLTIVGNFLFFMVILDLKSHSRTLFKITWAYIVFHLVVTVFLPVWAADPGKSRLAGISSLLTSFCEVLCLVLDILFVLHMRKRGPGIYRYLFYGTAILTIGMFFFTISSIFITHEPFISKTGSVGEYIFMGFFMFSEVWFFIMALSQREKQTELANARYQQELIAQLYAGKIMQENFSKSLERQVAERSEEILRQQQLLEEERRDKLLAVLNRRISETELKALRSQMNPHFIFNSLNSIENFMMKNDKRMASDYFGKFASLIRMILDSSSVDSVPFDKDMEALQLYVQLEQLRFNNKFTYRTQIDESLGNGNYNVPPLLIQPYVENAIVHGLAQSDKEDLLLQVKVHLDGEGILYTIEDNGIGRNQALIYQRQNNKRHRSMGMEITRQRIDLLNSQMDAGGTVDIIDLYDDQKMAQGTRVLVKIKVLLISFALSFGAMGIGSPAGAQQRDVLPGIAPLPAGFYRIKDHGERLIFLRKLLDDSDDHEQYGPVRDWALAGVAYATAYEVDSMKGQFYKDLGEVYNLYYHHPDSAIYYYKRSLSFYPEKTNKRHIFLDRRIAWNYSALGNKDSTMAYLNELEAIIAELPEPSKLKVFIAEDLATLYNDYGLNRRSILYFQYASDASLQSGDTAVHGLALVNLGDVYDQAGEEGEAIHFTRESLLFLEGNKDGQASAYSNLGSFYLNLRRYDSALYNLDRGDSIAAAIGDSAIYHTNAIIRAEALISSKGATPGAEYLLRNGLQYFKANDDQVGTLKSLLYYGDFYVARSDYRRANAVLDSALQLARKGDNKLFVAMALERLSRAAAAHGDYRSALGWQSQFTALKDTISLQKAKDELTQYETSYKTRQREEQIRSLTKDNQIKDLRLQNGRRLIYLYVLVLSGLLVLTLVLFYQRSIRNKIRTSQMKAELETRILRAQMNPHFIFNCLNSIENFMLKNDKKMASDYFERFSSLMRLILESTTREGVPLSKDMETLRLYIELEQLRFRNKFSYQAIVDPQLMNEDFCVPPLLIQPYIENAILHGLSPSDRDELTLQVAVVLDDGNIQYTIQDNGIGRTQSALYRKEASQTHKSLGMDIARQRVAFFNGHAGKKNAINITDLFDDQGEPAGTRIRIKIKAT